MCGSGFMPQVSIRSTSRSCAAISSGVKYRLPRTFGFDASGIVLSAGTGNPIKPGDAVYLRTSRETIGTFAEQIALPENSSRSSRRALARRSRVAAAGGPDHAAGFRPRRRPRRQRILIHAGAGGITLSRFNMQGISAFTSPRPRVRRTPISSSRSAPTESLPMTARTISNRAATTTSSTIRSAAPSRSTPSGW